LNGVLLKNWSGNIPWSDYTFPITAGTHTLEWRYSKSLATSVGDDAAYIDDVNLPLLLPHDSSSAATLSVLRQSDGTALVTLQGQTNQLYTIQSSANLNTWRQLATGTAADGILRVADPSSSTNRTTFYRAFVP